MLYAFPIDRTGCGFYRVIWPLGEIRDRVPHRVIYPGDEVPLLADIKREANMAPVVKGVQTPADCSAVLLQRPTSTLLVQCIPYLKAKNIKIIIEVDDDLHALSPKHASHKYLHNPEPLHAAMPSRNLPAFVSDSADNLLRACDLADLVICSTPALAARYAPDPARHVILRNRLRSDWASCLKAPPSGTRSGPPHTAPRVSAIDKLLWGGVIETHPDDLVPLRNVVPYLHGVEFVVAGPQSPAGPAAVGSNNITYTGSVPFADWLSHLSGFADGSTVAVAPLEPSPFNEAKSWLKPLEYMAVGLPFVATNTPEYTRLANCLGMLAPHVLAGSKSEWRTAVQTLIASPSLRDDLIAKGREIAAICTYQSYADDWHRALGPHVEGSSPF